MLLSSCSGEQHGGESADGSLSLLHQDKKTLSTAAFAQRALQERRLKPPDQIISCPRCQSLNTKFCYYNNYSLTQPRHFCKNCRRYWTAGGTLRNVPVGGGCRKNKRAKQRNTDLSSVLSSAEPSRNDGGGGSALHPAYNPTGTASSAPFFAGPFDLDPANRALRQSLRAGPSGVSPSHESNGISSNGHVSAFSVTHGSQAGGMSHSAQSTYDAPGIMSLGFFPPVKPDVVALANGDLSAMFEQQHAQNFRSAAAAAAAAGGGPALGAEGIGYPINLEHLSVNGGGMGAADAQWRGHHATSAAAAQTMQAAHMWGAAEDEQEHRGESSRPNLHHEDEKGLMESLRQVKGKSAVLSPSRGVEEGEPVTTRALALLGPGGPMWAQVAHVAPEPLQTFEPVSHDSQFWTNQNWPPLGDLQGGMNGNNNNGNNSNNNGSSTQLL